MEAAEYPIVVGILLTISILGGTANSLVIALFVRNKKASPLYCLLCSTLRLASKSKDVKNLEFNDFYRLTNYLFRLLIYELLLKFNETGSCGTVRTF
jgi:hypothetical protein